jgi:hypothetical protein
VGHDASISVEDGRGHVSEPLGNVLTDEIQDGINPDDTWASTGLKVGMQDYSGRQQFNITEILSCGVRR